MGDISHEDDGRTSVRGRAAAAAMIVALFLVVATPPTAKAYPRPGETTFISEGEEASVLPPGVLSVTSYGSMGSAISANGRFVVFDSDRPNLVAGDTNLVSDIFVRDLERGVTERVSVSSTGAEGSSYPTRLVADGRCYYVAPGGVAQGAIATRGAVISANGRYAAFLSCFDNLVDGDTNRSVDVFVHDRVKNATTRVNVSTKGDEVERSAGPPSGVSISADGRFVTFTSGSSKLVEGDTNGNEDVFVHDRKTGVTERVSVNSEGDEASATATCSSLNRNGRYVAFMSTAPNLVADDANSSPDIFVRDRKTRTTERVSTASDGSEANEGATLCYADTLEPPKGAISGDGRYVVFTSLSTDLVPNHTKNPIEVQDTYLKDRSTGRIQRISVTSNGEEIRGPSEQGAISLNGRFIVFWAYNAYSPEDTGDWDGFCVGCGDPDVFVFDRYTGAVDWASRTTKGGEAHNCNSIGPSWGAGNPTRLDETTSYSGEGTISADGRYVGFVSCGDNITPDDKDTVWDVFIRDRGATLGVGAIGGPPDEAGPDPQTCVLPDVCIPICITPEICIPPDSRLVAKDRGDHPSVVEDGGDLIGSSVAYRPHPKDLFVTEEVQHMPSLHIGAAGMFSTAGSPSILYGLRFNLDDKSYEVRATSLLGGTFGLFDCTTHAPACTKVGDLRGGYGTTGMRVVFSLPLKELGLEDGGELSHVEAFSAIGSYLTGASKVLDTVAFKY